MLAESPTLLRTLPMPDKVLAMDLSPPFPSAPPAGADTTPRAVIAMTGRVVHIFALRKLREAVDARKDAQGQDATGPEWEPEQRRESSLKFMLRDVRCMPAGDGKCERAARCRPFAEKMLITIPLLSFSEGYATSSVEGRIAVEFFDPSAEAQARKYAFKCHRQVIDGVDTVYPVNAIAFHPV